MSYSGYDIPFKVTAPDQIKLQKAFQEMAEKDKRSIMISAFRKATKPTLDATRANINSKSGNLKRSIGLLVMRNEVAVILGARRRHGYKGFHGHLLEDGTKQRGYVAKKTTHIKTPNGWHSVKAGERVNTGKGPATHFFSRAIASTGNTALNIMAQEWQNSIEKFHRKHGLK